MTNTRPFLEIGQHNVLFITVDSCRYDTALNSNLLINRIARLRKAETPATYTLPAHISFFVGILPILRDNSKFYLPGVEQIWRSSSAKSRDKSVLISYEGETILDYYIKNGYQVVGAGGVSFFRDSKYNILPKFFPKFLHFEKPHGVSSSDNIPRDKSQLPLANIDKIVKSFDQSKPYFLFINCPETHVPYDCPGMRLSNNYKEIIKKMYSIDFLKYKKNFKKGLSRDEREILKNAQKESLQWVDKQIINLINTLNGNKLPTLLVVVGDHGEEFGEGGRYGHAHNHPTVEFVPLWCTIIPPK